MVEQTLEPESRTVYFAAVLSCSELSRVSFHTNPGGLTAASHNRMPNDGETETNEVNTHNQQNVPAKPNTSGQRQQCSYFLPTSLQQLSGQNMVVRL